MTTVVVDVSRATASEAAIAFRQQAPMVAEDILNNLEMHDGDQISVRIDNAERAVQHLKTQRERVAGGTEKRTRLARFEHQIDKQL